jgi:hypothetical protein
MLAMADSDGDALLQTVDGARTMPFSGRPITMPSISKCFVMRRPQMIYLHT